jgi:circadian clock protein KaiB
MTEPRSEDRKPEAADAGPRAALRLRLYISPPTPSSLRARANLNEIIGSLGSAADHVSVEIIDVTAHPLRALKDRIIVTPTLTICDDSEVPPVVGDLSNTAVVKHFLVAAFQKCPG